MGHKELIIFFLILALGELFIKINCDILIDPKKTLIYGPGLKPDKIVLPARYFYIEFFDSNGERFQHLSDSNFFAVSIHGKTKQGRQCRSWINKLNNYDGTFIIRYKIYESCFNMEIHIIYETGHIGESPYRISNPVHPDECSCPSKNFNDWFEEYDCDSSYPQIDRDLLPFDTVNFDEIREKLINKYHSPTSSSFCNYVIKNNKIYRTCYGQHVGFKMFSDAILLSLSRKVHLPDLEFFINLGDWPLIDKRKADFVAPMFSWCGSDQSYDIVLPTYDITESTLENMGRVMLDMLSVQSHSAKIPWNKKIEKIFWRGRDSRWERLKLINISREHPDLFNVSLTNFFFFKNEESQYGPKTKHVSFFDFFNYKYQLNIDGTVAAYRFPYLLAGTSLVFKQESQYYEFFYHDLQPWVHYIPVVHDLSDVFDKIKWALTNDEEAQQISRRGRNYAQQNLLPHKIICYHAALLKNWKNKLINTIQVNKNMEFVPQINKQNIQFQCECNTLHDEL